MTSLQPETLILRLPNWVGDLVMLTPSLKLIRKSFPQSHIIGIGKGFSEAIIGSNQVVDTFLTPPRNSLFKRLRSLASHHISESSWGVLFTHSMSSALEMALLNPYRRIGYQGDGRSPLLTDALAPCPLAMDQVYGHITSYVTGSFPTGEPELLTDEPSREWYQSLCQKEGIQSEDPIIGLNPGAGYGETKRWWVEHFIQLGKMLQAHRSGIRFLVFSGPGEEHLGDQITEGIGASAVNVGRYNPGLNRLKACFDHLSAHITNDSGLRWFSVAKQIPTFILFGGSDPALTACFLKGCVILREPKPCSPCKFRVCPTGHECMRDLRPERVFESVITNLRW